MTAKSVLEPASSSQESILPGSRAEEQQKWDSYYEGLPLVEPDDATRQFNDRFARQIIDLLPTRSAILEAGCGGGWQSLALARTGRFDVHLMDFSRNALQYAERLFARERVRARFIQGDALEPGHPEFDLVFNLGVLEHYTPDQQIQFLRGMASRSRRFVLAIIPNRLCYWYWLWRIQRSAEQNWPFGKEVPQLDLSAVFEGAGLRFRGQIFLGEGWTDGFIAGLAGLDATLRDRLLAIHRSPLIPAAQRSYLVAALGSVASDDSPVPDEWELPLWQEPFRESELYAAVADSLALRIAAEHKLAHRDEMDQQRIQNLIAGSMAKSIAELTDAMAQTRQANAETQRELEIHRSSLLTLQLEVTHARAAAADLQQELTRTCLERDGARAACDAAAQRDVASAAESARLRADVALRDTQIRTLQRERDSIAANESRLGEEIQRLQARRQSASGTAKDFVWALLRRAAALAPLTPAARSRIKAVFYGAFGSMFPTSAHYRRYLEYRDAMQRLESTRRAPAAEPSSGRRTGPRPCDIIVFPVIDWNFRHQRPQHLALQLAARGHRVFYVTTTFQTGPDVAPAVTQLAPQVMGVTLPCSGEPPVIYRDAATSDQLDRMLAGLDALREQFDLGATVSVIDHPFWYPLAARLSNNRIVYDCMDHHFGFSNTGSGMAELEDQLQKHADVVVVTSQRLFDAVAPRTRRCALIRNAGEYERFAERPTTLALPRKRPVIGYYGAISEWFDTALMARVAQAMPDCDVVLVGSTYGADLAPLTGLTNVTLVGEVPYQKLTEYLYGFDVCVIPFKINELTLCTNPVKVYEYLAAGKPVVSVPLPELQSMGDVLTLAPDDEAFIDAIRAALREPGPDEIARRQAFARENTWAQRGAALSSELSRIFPRVSIVILTHNQLDFTRACLASIERYSDYPDWELVIVDNGSSDKSPAFLREYAASRPYVRLVLQNENVGFAAGCNRGARAATGDYLVFLNNDTFVTSGWIADMLAHFQRTPGLALLNPVTNNIGNEARIEINYATMDEMAAQARHYTRAHAGQRLEMPVAAFFCVMVPAAIWREIGELDEQFGQGFFEDDDYAMRIRQRGYTIACAEDVFVHHHLSASFNKLADARRQELFNVNRKYYESKWGTWVPHQYRDHRPVDTPASPP